MSINVSGNVLSSTGFDSSGNIINTPNIVTDGLALWYDAGNLASYNNSPNYYDCGYGCQYYGSSPGCTSCNTQIKDMSGYGNDGTFSGNASVIYNNTGGQMYFDGTTDYVTIGTDAMYASPSNITLDFWCYPMRNASYEYLISNARDCCGSYNGYNLTFSSSTPSFEIWNGTNASVNPGTSYSLNQYYNVVGTYDGSNMKIYVNGVLTGTTATSLGIGTPASFTTYIGRMGLGDAYCFNGYIPISRVYNLALTQTQITQNFNSERSRFGI